MEELMEPHEEFTGWTLSPEEYALPVERVKAINRRAAKRGFTGRVEVTGTRREVTEKDKGGLPRTHIVVDTTITGQAPCYNGWRFLAAVDTVETEDGPAFVLRTAPGVEESGVDREMLKAGHCEHCKTARTNRKYTYLVQNPDTEELLQVGSTCIKDFTGWTGKPVFISEAELAEELEGFLGGLGGSPLDYTVETVVAAAWGISRRYGWVPVSAAGYGTSSTRDLVNAYLYGTAKSDNELRADVAPEMAEATDMAKTIVTALLEGLEGNGDYVTNLRICLRAAVVEDRHMGIVVSAVSAYEKMTGKQTERKAREQRVSEFAGAVGEKTTFTGTITRMMPVENNFGYHATSSMLVIVEDEKHTFKMFTSAAWAWDVKQGQAATFTGTVKDHEDYQGTKQTAIARPKLVTKPIPEPTR
jgi:hypothetical protein